MAAMDTTEIIFGDYAPTGYNYALASIRGRRVHYTNDWDSTYAASA